jgi:hypothetical protein
MNQRLADWASVAEIIGAFAIVVSLIFVGLQVKDNTLATQAATQQQSLAFEFQILAGLSALDEETNAQFAYISQGIDQREMTLAEQRATNYYTLALRWFEDLFLQWKAGSLADEAWEARRSILVGYANGPGIEEVLEGGFLVESFSRCVRSIQAGQDCERD